MQQPIIHDSRFKNISGAQRAADSAESEAWKGKTDGAPKPVKAKTPLQPLQKKQALKEVKKKQRVAAGNAVHEVRAVESAADEYDDYMPPAVRLAVQRNYAPAEDEIFEFCRPAPISPYFDDPNVFAGWVENLQGRICDPRLTALLQEEHAAREMLSDYRHAMVLECR